MTPPFLMNQEKFKRKTFEKLLVRIKIYRAGNGITQSEMAAKLGLSLRTYQRVEQGVAPLDIETLYAVSKVFNIPYKNLAGPNYSEEDIPNAQFFWSLDDVPNLSHETITPFKELIKDLNVSLNEENVTFSELHKQNGFKDCPLPAYFSDPKWTYINKVLRKGFDPSLKGRVSVMRNLSDFEFIIKVWEVCYNGPKKVYTCQTIYENEGAPTMEVTTLNFFDLYEGFPFTIGTILGAKPLSTP